MITATQIQKRMFQELFSQPLMDNSFRGIWCEYMVAEALGPECRTVGAGWHAWDLQIGDSTRAFPERIRIQVKNCARLQSWNAKTGIESKCEFHLKYRKQPYYFDKHNADVPCEECGFLCDVYVLCLHDEADPKCANHGDLSQWKFFVLPVVGPNIAVTEKELAATQNRRSATIIRRPETLEKGIRGRPPVPALGIDDLTVDAIRRALGLL